MAKTRKAELVAPAPKKEEVIQSEVEREITIEEHIEELKKSIAKHEEIIEKYKKHFGVLSAIIDSQENRLKEQMQFISKIARVSGVTL